MHWLRLALWMLRRDTGHCILVGSTKYMRQRWTVKCRLHSESRLLQLRLSSETMRNRTKFHCSGPVSIASNQCSSSSAIEYESICEKPTNRLHCRFACSLGDPEPLEYCGNKQYWQWHAECLKMIRINECVNCKFKSNSITRPHCNAAGYQHELQIHFE